MSMQSQLILAYRPWRLPFIYMLLKDDVSGKRLTKQQ